MTEDSFSDKVFFKLKGSSKKGSANNLRQRPWLDTSIIGKYETFDTQNCGSEVFFISAGSESGDCMYLAAAARIKYPVSRGVSNLTSGMDLRAKKVEY